MRNARLFCLIGVLCLSLADQVKAMTAEGTSELARNDQAIGDPPAPSERQSLFGDRLSLKVGYKVWVARWQTTAVSGTVTGVTGGPRQITTHDSVMSGPSATMRLALRDSPWFNSLITSFTFLNGGFDFEKTGFNTIPFAVPGGPQQEQYDATRKDYTATVGVSIWESVGLFAGYYWTEQRFTVDNVFQNTPGGNTFHTRSNPTRELQGPLFGLYASGAVNDRFSLYGNVAYALLNLRSSQAGFNTTDVQGWAFEVGTSIRGPNIWKIGTDLQVGFRGQMILKTFGENRPDRGSPANTFGNDVTWGPTLMVSAVF